MDDDAEDEEEERENGPVPLHPPQAPPRRRHSQGNLQALSLQGSFHNRPPMASASTDHLDGPVEDLKISVRDRKKLFDSFSSENLLSSPPVPPLVSPSNAKPPDNKEKRSAQQAASRNSLGSHDPIGK
jgi:hypothetical protein